MSMALVNDVEYGRDGGCKVLCVLTESNRSKI